MALYAKKNDATLLPVRPGDINGVDVKARVSHRRGARQGREGDRRGGRQGRGEGAGADRDDALARARLDRTDAGGGHSESGSVPKISDDD
jgi:hypothetical protein